MPYRDPEPDDPHELVGVSVPADRESMREMAATFAEEFAALGYDETHLLNLFRQPFYAGAHRAYQALGEVKIHHIVRESLAVWGHCRVVVRDAARAKDKGAEQLVQLGSEKPGEPKIRD
jgi:hypothetical protein